ncbi:MAG: lactate racemase domain-containing protein [Candidatus Poribacteria bacterium]|nr:lactate racemase domain-containing protein [Candidatus Poribacteria bacterium]
MQSVQVLTAAWYGDREVNLTFPDNWDLNVIAFEKRPVLTEDQMRQAFHQPIGSPRIAEMAKGKESAVLIADDLTRPTPTSKVIPFILEELQQGGISEENIIIFMGFGCHRSMKHADLVKKLGEDTVRRFRIKQNELDDPYIYLGETSRGVPLHVNQWVMDCDIKIGIGGAWPHGTAAFSGGGKIVIPGVSNFKTISTAHGTLKGGGTAGNVENEFRLNSEEAARMLGVNATVITTLNDRRQITALFVGDVVDAHRAASEVSRVAYGVTPMTDADIVVTTGYPRDHDLSYGQIGGWPMKYSQPEATRILVSSGDEGVCYHRAGILGAKRQRAEENREREERKPLVRSADWDYILFSQAVGLTEVLEAQPRAKLMESWDEILDFLKQKYRDQKPKVAIYPSAAIAYPLE